MSARDVAIALGGLAHTNAVNFAAPCPCAKHGQGRGDRHPSLSLSDSNDGKLLAFCHGGCNPLDVLAELRRRGLVDTDRRSGNEHRDLADYARTLWHEAVPITGTLAERYLRQRAISITLPPSLRCHHRVKVPRSPLHFPAMIAAVSGDDHKVVSVQVTWLDPSAGNKAAIDVPRRTFGKLGDCAVRLGGAGDTLGLAEGVETALSVSELFNVPCWATLGVERFAKIEIPPTVKRLHFFADGKDGKAERAAQCFARRFTVRVHHPDDGGDYNDALRARKVSA